MARRALSVRAGRWWNHCAVGDTRARVFTCVIHRTRPRNTAYTGRRPRHDAALRRAADRPRGSRGAAVVMAAAAIILRYDRDTRAPAARCLSCAGLHECGTPRAAAASLGADGGRLPSPFSARKTRDAAGSRWPKALRVRATSLRTTRSPRSPCPAGTTAGGALCSASGSPESAAPSRVSSGRHQLPASRVPVTVLREPSPTLLTTRVRWPCHFLWLVALV